MELSKEILKGLLDMFVMFSIAKEPKHGYRIAKTINETTGGLIELQDGTLYPILHRLEKKGALRGKWVQTGTARKRKEYALTPQGEETLREQARQWRSLSAVLESIVEDVL